MLAAVVQAVRECEVPASRDGLIVGFATYDELGAKLLAAVGEFEAAGSHQIDDGSVSMAAWLRHQCGMTSSHAHRVASHARKLRRMPAVIKAMADGRLSSGQVDAILANVPQRHVELFAEHAPELIDSLAVLAASDVALVVQEWRKAADTASGDDDLDPPDDEAERPPSKLHLSDLLDGYGQLDATLRPELMAELRVALRLADSGDLDVIPSERRAEALGVVVRFFLDHQQDKPAGARHRPHVNLVLQADELNAARVVGGTALDDVSSSVLLCDSVIHRLLVGRSGILDYGRASRIVPVDLWNALVLRDEHCRWPGCDRPAAWCDAHHVEEWQHGGATNLGNLALFCRRHHRKAHERGWQVKLLPDATLEVTSPDGRTERSRPRGPTPQQLWPRAACSPDDGMTALDTGRRGPLWTR